MDKLIKFWLSIARRNNWRFAFLRTENAIYDRVAVIDSSPISMDIEYPKRVKGKWTIVHEKLAIRDIVKGRYYQN